MDKQDKHGDPLEVELRRYILGELTEQDEESFERRLMTGNDELLQEAEEFAEVLHDELVEDYLSGRLTGAQRAAFELRLLPSGKIREKLILDKALRAKVRRRNGRSLAERLGAWIRPVLRPVPALAMCTNLLLLTGFGWSVHRMALLQGRLDEAASRQVRLTAAQESLRSQVDQEHQRNDALAREVAAAASRQRLAPTGGQGLFAVASFILNPGLVRSGGQMAQVAIASGHGLVELKLDVGLDEYPSYRAALHDSSDNELMVASKLRAAPAGRSVYVAVQLPAQVLRADDYQLRLSGVTASGQIVKIDSYPFRVVRR